MWNFQPSTSVNQVSRLVMVTWGSYFPLPFQWRGWMAAWSAPARHAIQRMQVSRTGVPGVRFQCWTRMRNGLSPGCGTSLATDSPAAADTAMENGMPVVPARSGLQPRPSCM